MQSVVAGSAPPQAPVALVDHLAACRRCRATFQPLATLRAAAGDGPVVNLPAVSEALAAWPEQAGLALAALSHRLRALVLPPSLVPRRPETLQLEEVSPEGASTGEVAGFWCEEGPRIDSAGHLRLILRQRSEPPRAGSLELALLDELGAIQIRPVALQGEKTVVDVALAPLLIAPGFLRSQALGGKVVATGAPLGAAPEDEIPTSRHRRVRLEQGVPPAVTRAPAPQGQPRDPGEPER
jgi:hypothetical protein